MSRAAICVVPSRWPEPFGLSALEAMAHGAALICSRRGALPEVAGDTALYANPEAPGATAAAILHLAEDTDRRETLKWAAHARAATFDARPSPAHRLQAAAGRLAGMKWVDRAACVCVLLCPVFLLHGRLVADILIVAVAALFLLRSALARLGVAAHPLGARGGRLVAVAAAVLAPGRPAAGACGGSVPAVRGGAGPLGAASALAPPVARPARRPGRPLHRRPDRAAARHSAATSRATAAGAMAS